jgi:hypothetical protein
MSSTVKIKESRPDLSDYLFHFTKNANAFETLQQIISDGQIKDINKNGVICFTEAPIYHMVEMFAFFNQYPNPMLAPYGIGIPLNKLFIEGARPVIYGPRKEITLLDETIHWRYEPLENGRDFAWLREWRLPHQVYGLEQDEIIVITNTEDEVNEYFHNIEVHIDGDWADGDWWDQSYVSNDRKYKTLSLESIIKLNINNKRSMNDELSAQNIVKDYD